MSKKRNFSLSTPRLIKSEQQIKYRKIDNPERLKTISHADLNSDKNNYKTLTMATEQDLSSIYNKNIGKFRDLVNSNDKSLLPFISSLRAHMLINKKKLTSTIIKPFQVSDKLTCNQKIVKDLNDIKRRSTRLTNALYRWQNKSGSGVKKGCYFESKLRQTKPKFQTDPTFRNLFNPINKLVIARRLYTESDIICPHQKKIFNFQL